MKIEHDATEQTRTHMNSDELSKLMGVISELQERIGDAPHSNPGALARMHEIAAALRADLRYTVYVGEKLESASDDMSYWFGNRDWRKRTTSMEHLRSMLLNSLEALRMAATTTYGEMS